MPSIIVDRTELQLSMIGPSTKVRLNDEQMESIRHHYAIGWAMIISTALSIFLCRDTMSVVLMLKQSLC